MVLQRHPLMPAPDETTSLSAEAGAGSSLALDLRDTIYSGCITMGHRFLPFLPTSRQ
jgi:hypothetical protein